MRRRLIWITGLVAGVVVVALVAATSLTAFVVQRSLPAYDGQGLIPGLATPVEVHRDANGIPQVYADTAEDLFRAQGYIHAQDRFLQMDLRRHVTSGRLSEWFGEEFIEADTFLRTLGWHHVAEREVSALEPASRGYLEAYSAGVNAYLEENRGSRLGIEYAWGLVGPDDPAPWTPADSLAWLKAMAWDLGTNMNDEIARVLIAAEVGEDRVNELYPAYPFPDQEQADSDEGESDQAEESDGAGPADPGADGHAPTVTEGEVVDGQFVQPGAEDSDAARPALPAEVAEDLERLAEITEDLPELFGRGAGMGSNAWVVDGSHTATGMPMLANDPHLGQEMPSIWYQVGLHCRERSEVCPFNVAGFGFAGVPGVIIGHNDQVSWGFTNLQADVMDLYVERVDGQSYLFDGERVPLATRREAIRVKGRDEPIEITVRLTRHGPILSDVNDQLAEVAEAAPASAEEPGGWTHVMALRWTALDAGSTGDALFALNLARDWESFREAAELFDSPTQNLLYADVEGNIGYQTPGRIPVRRTGDGRWPAPGWKQEYAWTAYVPFEELPSAFNPEDGFIVSANQAVVGPDYPHHLADVWAYGYRSERIRELIETSDELTVEDMVEFQLDDVHLFADTLVPRLLEVEGVDAFTEEGRRLLRDWDGSQDVDSGAAAYFNAVWQNLLRSTFGTKLPRSQWPQGNDRWYEVVRQLLDEPEHDWWDDPNTDQRETADDMLREALVQARLDLTSSQAKDPARWRWGKEHTIELHNPVLGQSGIGPVESVYNRGPIELPGGTDAVFAASWSAASSDYAVGGVPSMRMVVDLDNLDRSVWINASGMSEHPRHEHYDDQLELWAEGKMLPWRFSARAVRSATTYTYVLEPGHG